MADKASQGQNLYETPLGSAGVINNVLEVAVDFQQRKRLGTGVPSQPWTVPTDIVKVINGKGTALRLGEIVELSLTPPLTDIVRTHPWFTAAIPNETKQFAILLEDVPNESTATGRAQIAGVCPALVNVGATTDQWAHVSSGLDVLQGDRFWGDVRILSTPAGTGEQLVWVQIEPSPQEWYGKADEEIVQDATGTVSIWLGSPPLESIYDISDCLNWSGFTVSEGRRCVVKRIGRKPFVEPLECEP